MDILNFTYGYIFGSFIGLCVGYWCCYRYITKNK